MVGLGRSFGDLMSAIHQEKESGYMKKLGNCKQAKIPGSHFIYEQKPKNVQLSLLIARFPDVPFQIGSFFRWSSISIARFADQSLL